MSGATDTSNVTIRTNKQAPFGYGKHKVTDNWKRAKFP